MEGDAKGRTRKVTSLTCMSGSAVPKLEVITSRGVIHLVKSQLFMLALGIFILTEVKLVDGSKVTTRKIWEALT